LHLDGILFPHINDDAQLKSHQIYVIFIAHARQKWLRERASISPYSALTVLLESV